MIDRVVTVRARDPGIDRAERAGECCDLVGRTGKPDDAAIEARQVLGQIGWSVTLRIDRHEHEIDLLGNGTELAHAPRDLIERGRTDYRAARETDVDDARPLGEPRGVEPSPPTGRSTRNAACVGRRAVVPAPALRATPAGSPRQSAAINTKHGRSPLPERGALRSQLTARATSPVRCLALV